MAVRVMGSSSTYSYHAAPLSQRFFPFPPFAPIFFIFPLISKGASGLRPLTSSFLSSPMAVPRLCPLQH